MKNPFKQEQTPKRHPSQQRLPTPPPALRDLTDADLEYVQGGYGSKEHSSIGVSDYYWQYPHCPGETGLGWERTIAG